MHFVYARVKEKELERSKNSDGVLLFFVPSSHREEFIFITQFSVFVCLFFFVRRERHEHERIFVFVREASGERGLEFLCVGTKRTNFISLSERTNTISHHFSRQIIKEWD